LKNNRDATTPTLKPPPGMIKTIIIQKYIFTLGILIPSE